MLRRQFVLSGGVKKHSKAKFCAWILFVKLRGSRARFLRLGHQLWLVLQDVHQDVGLAESGIREGERRIACRAIFKGGDSILQLLRPVVLLEVSPSAQIVLVSLGLRGA